MSLTHQIYKRFNSVYIKVLNFLITVLTQNYCEHFTVITLLAQDYCEHSKIYKLCHISDPVKFMLNTNLIKNSKNIINLKQFN